MGRSTSTRGGKVYLDSNVYEEAVKRVSLIFDEFEEIIVSISGGKDSTVVFNLALEEARRRDRMISAFFLDQEAEYQATIDIIKESMYQENVEPHWIQVPIYMRNITSYKNPLLYAWGEGEKWMREKDPVAVHEIDGEYPMRFNSFIDFFEDGWAGESACFLVGLRAEESLNRYRAVTKYPGHKDLHWTTMTRHVMKAYPIYDWTFEDVWIYFLKEGIKYNKIYDHLYKSGFHVQEMRVSNLIHGQSYRSLVTLQKFEPETYDKLVERLQGVHIAARYGGKDLIFEGKMLPTAFDSWVEWRNFLLLTSPLEDKEEFAKRYEKMDLDEHIARQQCKQLLLNDYENGFKITKEDKERRKRTRAKWEAIL